MNMGDWGVLAKLTLTDPAEAARRLLAMRLGRDVLWLALALAVVLNTTLQAASNLAFPQVETQFQGLTGSLISYAAIVGGGLVLTIAMFYRVGRGMGGSGSFNDMMVLMVWLQFLRVAVQAAGLILLLTVPALSMFLALAAMLAGIYITVHFIDQAHHLNSVAKAAGIMVLSIIAIAVFAILLLSLVGGPITGSAAYV